MNQVEILSNPPPPVTNRSPWRWTDILLITLASGILLVGGMIAIGIALVLVNGRSTATEALSSPLVSIAAGALEAIALIGSVYLLGLRRHHTGWSALGLRPTSVAWLLAGLGLGILVIPLSSVIATTVQTALGQPLQNPQEAFLLPTGLNLPAELAMIFLVGIAGPFAEEIFFRGVIFNWLRGRWGFIPSALVTSLLFGLAHVEPSLVVATFVLGFVIAAAYEASHSLWTSFLIHATNNTAVIVALYVALALGVKF